MTGLKMSRRHVTIDVHVDLSLPERVDSVSCEEERKVTFPCGSGKGLSPSMTVEMAKVETTG